jgi:aryl-alcohol dehydrogenase
MPVCRKARNSGVANLYPLAWRLAVKIQAAVLREPKGKYVIETVDLAEPRANEVLVRVVGTGMCHTDVVPRLGRGLAALPIITGHEGAGVVETVGSDVKGISVDDHVVLSFDSCGVCSNCRNNQPAYCETFFPRNLSGRYLDGSVPVKDEQGKEVLSRWFGQSSFATHCIATARNAVVVDKSLPLQKLGPLGCGVQTGAGSILVAMNVQPGSSLVVFGAGAVGLSAVMAGKVAGATTIIAVDLQQHRLDLAKELGATHVFEGTDPELVSAIRKATGGGANYSFDTTGNPTVMQTALAVLRMTGVCGYVGAQTGDLVLSGRALFGKTAIGIIEGSANPQEFIPRMIKLWREGRFPFDRMIQEFPMSQINEAEESSLAGRAIKPVLTPGK